MGRITPTKEDISLCIAIIKQSYDLEDYSYMDIANLLNLEFANYKFTDTDVYRYFNTSEIVEVEERDAELIYQNML